ncbi:hypothetical protein [Methylocystis bryophila]|uniref:hypothetical protein n=1 Tax=Methylocystis bryophila TaxID=655015 RepID=UPI00131A3F64|nr:hypothetical protein [Methylocystis bryophila]BDV39156.1 hypothetical protein DSM21852_24090 [Methylocystis bryophila]
MTQGESAPVRRRIEEAPGAPADIWFARGAVLVIVALQFLFVNEVTILPRWVMPTLELALLLPLSVATVWTLGVERKRAAGEIEGDLWIRLARRRRMIHTAFFLLTALVSVANLFALAGLVHEIMHGHANSGKSLLADALNIWATNVIIFSLWYWNLDKKLPGAPSEAGPHFIFTQQTVPVSFTRRIRAPGYIDYLFLAFTNATAFSPSDTFPLTPRAKLLMMTEAIISLVTIVLVAARAVGMLA